MLPVGGTIQHGEVRRACPGIALLVVAWVLAGSPACGRVGYDGVASVPADARLPTDAGGADVAAPGDGPAMLDADGPAVVDADGPVVVEAAPERPVDVAPDQPRLDVGPVMPARCTEPGGRIDPTRGNCYFMLSMSSGLWADARAGCEGQGGHLATLTSPAEQAFAVSLLGTEELWIGLFQVGTGAWQWVTGEPVAFLAWAPLEPDEPSEGRARLTPDGWHGTDMRRRYLALCERDP